MVDRPESESQQPHSPKPHEWLGVLPPRVHGSVADLPSEPLEALRPEHDSGIFDPSTPWWRPDTGHITRTIGWGWLLIIPSIVAAFGLPIVAAVYTGSIFAGQVANLLKLSAFLIAVAVTLVLRAVRMSVQSRRGLFCIHCGYTLEGLASDGVCPECGRGYRQALIEEFKKDPHFFAARGRALARAPRFEPFFAGSGPTANDGTR